MLRGSTKLIKIVHVEISGAITTAADYIVSLKKHTIANTGGTSTNPTPTLHDSSDGVATGTILLYTAAPTTDASATIWKSIRLYLQAPAAAAIPQTYIYDYLGEPYEPLTLRGVTQEFAFNLGGVAIGAGQVYDFAVTWTEQ